MDPAPWKLIIPKGERIQAAPTQAEPAVATVNLIATNTPTMMEVWELYGIWLPVLMLVNFSAPPAAGQQIILTTTATLLYGGDIIWSTEAAKQAGVSSPLFQEQLFAGVGIRDNLQNPQPIRRGRTLQLQVTAAWAYVNGAEPKATQLTLAFGSIANLSTLFPQPGSIDYYARVQSGHRTL